MSHAVYPRTALHLDKQPRIGYCKVPNESARLHGAVLPLECQPNGAKLKVKLVFWVASVTLGMYFRLIYLRDVRPVAVIRNICPRDVRGAGFSHNVTHSLLSLRRYAF